MMKHIIGQAVFQITVLLVLLFFGQTFIPEYADGYDTMIGNNLDVISSPIFIETIHRHTTYMYIVFYFFCTHGGWDEPN